MCKKTIVPRITISLLILFILIGCDNDDSHSEHCICTNSEEQTCVLYEQTGCADPWRKNNADDNQLINNITTYFDSLGVTLIDVGIDNNGQEEACYACHCKTGRRICAKVNNDHLETILGNGFIKNE